MAIKATIWLLFPNRESQELQFLFFLLLLDRLILSHLSYFDILEKMKSILGKKRITTEETVEKIFAGEKYHPMHEQNI